MALHLYDIQHCGMGGGEDAELGALERTVAPPWHSPISFAWHPTHAYRLLAVSQQGLSLSKKEKRIIYIISSYYRTYRLYSL